MDEGNCSSMTEFIFLGITDNTEDKVTIFTMVLIVYLTGQLANLGMIFLIKMDPQLNTQAVFFILFSSWRFKDCVVKGHIISLWDDTMPVL